MVERVRRAAGGTNFIQIVDELGVKPSRLSRWVSGMVPLDQNDIRSLVKSLGPRFTLFRAKSGPTVPSPRTAIVRGISTGGVICCNIFATITLTKVVVPKEIQASFG